MAPAPATLRSASTSHELTFRSSGVHCVATLALPAGAGPHPGVLIAHGFTCDRHMRLDPYVAGLTAGGFAVLTFDPRHVGESDGQPRNLVDPEALVDDTLAALALLRSRPEVSDDVGLIGFSLGGGIALEAAVRDGGLGALAHVVGLVAPRTRSEDDRNVLLAIVGADLAADAAGEPPVTLPICAPIGEPGLIAASDAIAGKDLLDETGDRVNATPARSLIGLASFAPAERAAELTCPTYFHVCRTDTAVDADATLDLAARLPGALVETYDGSHFDVFTPERAPALADTLARFLTAALAAAPSTPRRSR
jgi:pimeloyl-ACP methyl ester carboxylesterase